MIKLKKRHVFALFFILIMMVSGCVPGLGLGKSGSKDAKRSIEDIRIGTEGISVSFLANAPPDRIVVEEGAPEEYNTFDLVLEVKNKGAYPQPDEGISGSAPGFGKVFLSGFDQKILSFESKDGKSGDLTKTSLEGKSTINPNGGQDILSFNGKVIVSKLNVEKYEPTLLATVCYRYFTTASQPVCIDPNPYSTVKEKKVCEVKSVTLSSQGGPIAVTRIDQEALASKTQFRITIKNVGGGDVFKGDSFDKCNPSNPNKITREDIDKVYLQEIRIADNVLMCGPFAESGIRGTTGWIRLVNNEGYLICELPKAAYQSSNTAFTTPIKIELSYAYRNTAEKKLQIKKEKGGDIRSDKPITVPDRNYGYD